MYESKRNHKTVVACINNNKNSKKNQKQEKYFGKNIQQITHSFNSPKKKKKGISNLLDESSIRIGHKKREGKQAKILS